MASSSLIHSSSRSFKYDIFLSFRGADTRKTFVDHLYSRLKQHSISVIYKDDETLARGESIRPSLLKAIEESRVAIIIFSKHYADSSWCLDELAHIMKCKVDGELIVMPIFYDVDPSDVRKQNGDFGIAFAKQEPNNINKSQLWRNALVDASNIAGWEPKLVANGHEAKVITEVVDAAFARLFPLNTDVDEGLVGMASRLQELKSELDIESGGVRMVGICGLGGIGKTTLATSMYMEICCNFQGHCIVENIREESSKNNFKKLQEKILLDIFKKQVYVPSVAEGKCMIKSMLSSRNVLVILDDVSHDDQLDALAGLHNWFGSGSRIIITTRDEHLLRNVDKICHARLLSDDDAMQLFNRHAYNEKIHVDDYETLSSRVVSYAAGLPLALKVLGSFLCDKEKKGWMSTLDRLKDIPKMEIVEKLKISYDGLEHKEKELFLDIACFWKGGHNYEIMEMLEACGYHGGEGIEVLKQRSLITVSRDGSIDMHDLVQEMGHYIVRGEHPNNPEKHSRLWKSEEINNMCLTMENDKIETLHYDHRYGSDLCLTSQFFKSVSNMKMLRYLRVKMASDMYCEEERNFLPNKLRYINLEGCGLRRHFADSFKPTNLGVLKLSGTRQKDLWNGCKHLPHLKVLELVALKNLRSTPDFDGLPCLQELELSRCSKLKEIHPSLGKHTSLQYVWVEDCEKLGTLPTIVHMENLKTLKIHDCPRIVEFPDIQANMESLLQLHVSNVGIEVVPSSILERCTNLTELSFQGLKNLRIIESNFDTLKHPKCPKLQGLKHPLKTRRQLFPQFLCGFQKLDLTTSRFKDVESPDNIVELSNLQELTLSFIDFSRIEFSLVQFTQLKILSVRNCKKLLELPELPSSLTVLIVNGCDSLKTFGDCHKNCARLCQVFLDEGTIINDSQRLLESMLEVCTSIENCPMALQLQGTEVAMGFIPCLHGGSGCKLQLPENWCSEDFSGFLICAVFEGASFIRDITISMNQVMSGMDPKDDVVWKESEGDDHTMVWYVSFGSLRHTTWWDPTYKALEFHIEGFMSKCCSGFGVRLVEKKSRSGLTQTSIDSSFSDTPQVEIKDDSESSLRICLSSASWYNTTKKIVF